MTRAKDISKIVTDADLSGTLDVTGTVTASAINVAGASGAEITITDNSPSTVSLYLGAGNSSVSIGSTTSDPVTFLTANTERMRISSGGDISFYEDTGTTPKLFWDASAEKLGVGSSSPVSALHVQGAGEADIFLRRTDLTNKAWLFNLATDGNLNFKYRNDDGSADGTSLVLDRSGNLLVGTTNVSPANGNVQGIALKTNNAQFSANANNAITANRMTSDGNIIILKKSGSDVGSIGVNGSNPFLANSSSRGISLGGNVVPCDSSGVKADNVSDLGIATGRFKDLYLSGGVYLGGTGSANKLDDYEEGTWTPVLVDASSGGNSSPSATYQVGTYTKVGRLVIANLFYLNFSLSGMTSGNAVYISGLPFTASNITGGFYGMIRVDRVTTDGATSYFIDASANRAGIIGQPLDGNAPVSVTVGNLQTNASDIRGSLIYVTDS